MAELNVTQRKLTPNQVACVLNDIAITANSIKRFSILLVDADDERDSSAMINAIGSMAERVGFLADMTAADFPLGAFLGDTAIEWMMPPLFHDDNNTAEA
jgi:hypothetical protein